MEDRPKLLNWWTVSEAMSNLGITRHRLRYLQQRAKETKVGLKMRRVSPRVILYEPESLKRIHEIFQ